MLEVDTLRYAFLDEVGRLHGLGGRRMKAQFPWRTVFHQAQLT